MHLLHYLLICFNVNEDTVVRCLFILVHSALTNVIKRRVPVLDSDWLSHVRSRCILHYKHTPLFTLCVARQPHLCLRNYIVFGRILFLLISLQLFALFYFVKAY